MAKQEPAKKPKTRKVKNPETFRDRALKASVTKTKKNRFAFLTKLIKRTFGAIVKPFKVVKRKLAKTKAGRLSKKLFKRPLHILSVILLISYFRSSFSELKQVTWPSWKQSWRLTFAVLAFAIVFGCLIAGLDWVLAKVAKEVLIK